MTDFLASRDFWRALRDQLAASAFIDPADDLLTQRGLVATAVAITERMADRHFPLAERQAHLAARIEANKPAPAAPALPVAARAPDDPIGGNAVAKPVPAPRAPRPGGNAVRHADAFALSL